MRLTILAAATLLAGPAAAADCGNATSQLALDQCAAADLQAADATLNAAYQQILGRLRGDPETTQLLRAAQRAWLGFRDSECAFAASAATQGSIYPMLVASCRAGLTRQRAEQLGSYLHCAEGDMGCPCRHREAAGRGWLGCEPALLPLDRLQGAALVAVQRRRPLWFAREGSAGGAWLGFVRAVDGGSRGWLGFLLRRAPGFVPRSF